MLKKKYLFSLLMVAVITLFACEKTKNNIIEDLMIKLITENVWYVSKFNVGGSSITSEFNGYDFHFGKDNAVRAKKAGQADVVGTWVGSQESQSITANFPGASAPVSKLTGVWLITNTDLDPKLVDSHRFEGSTEFVMRLNAR